VSRDDGAPTRDGARVAFRAASVAGVRAEVLVEDQDGGSRRMARAMAIRCRLAPGQAPAALADDGVIGWGRPVMKSVDLRGAGRGLDLRLRSRPVCDLMFSRRVVSEDVVLLEDDAEAGAQGCRAEIPRNGPGRQAGLATPLRVVRTAMRRWRTVLSYRRAVLPT
jgi:hypothetical protein